MIGIIYNALQIFAMHTYINQAISTGNTFLDGGRQESSLIANILLNSIFFLALVINIFFPHPLIMLAACILSACVVTINLFTAKDSTYADLPAYLYGGISLYTAVQAAVRMIHEMMPDIKEQRRYIVLLISIELDSRRYRLISNIFSRLADLTFSAYDLLTHIYHPIATAVQKTININVFWRAILRALTMIYWALTPCIIYFAILQNPILNYELITYIATHSFFYFYHLVENYKRQYISPRLAFPIQFFSFLLSDFINNASFFGRVSLGITTQASIMLIMICFKALSYLNEFAFKQDKVNLAARLVYTSTTIFLRSTIPAIIVSYSLMTRSLNSTVQAVRSLVSRHSLFRYYYKTNAAIANQDIKLHFERIGNAYKNINDTYQFQTTSLYKHYEEIPIINSNIDQHIPALLETVSNLIKSEKDANKQNAYAELIWSECIEEDSLNNGAGLLSNCPLPVQSADTKTKIQEISNFLAQALDGPHALKASLVRLFNTLSPQITNKDIDQVNEDFKAVKDEIELNNKNIGINKNLRDIQRRLARLEALLNKNSLNPAKTEADKAIRSLQQDKIIDEIIENIQNDKALATLDPLNKALHSLEEQLHLSYTTPEIKVGQIKPAINAALQILKAEPNKKLQAFFKKIAITITLDNWKTVVHNVISLNKLTPDAAANLSGTEASQLDMLNNHLRNFWAHMQSYAHSSISNITQNSDNELRELLTRLKNDNIERKSELEAILSKNTHWISSLNNILKNDNDIRLPQDIAEGLPYFIIEHRNILEAINLNTLKIMSDNFLLACLRSLQSCGTGLLDALRTEHNIFSFGEQDPKFDRSLTLALTHQYQNMLASYERQLKHKLGSQLDQADGIHTANAIDNIIKLPIGLADFVAFSEIKFLELSSTTLAFLFERSFELIRPATETAELLATLFGLLNNIYTQNTPSFDTPTKRTFARELEEIINNEEITSEFIESFNYDWILSPRNAQQEKLSDQWHGVALAMLLKHGFIMPEADKVNANFNLQHREFILSASKNVKGDLLAAVVYPFGLLKDVSMLFLLPVRDALVLTWNLLTAVPSSTASALRSVIEWRPRFATSASKPEAIKAQSLQQQMPAANKESTNNHPTEVFYLSSQNLSTAKN